MPTKLPLATRIKKFGDNHGIAWSLYKLKEPIKFSHDEEQVGYLLIERKLSSYYVVVRTAWFEYDNRWETQAFPSDDNGKPLDLKDLFTELRPIDHDQFMKLNGYEVRVYGN